MTYKRKSKSLCITLMCVTEFEIPFQVLKFALVFGIHSLSCSCHYALRFI